MKITKMTNKELFIQEIDKHWDNLRKNEDTIFENIETQMDAELKYLLLQENSNTLYMEYISENSLYEKKKLIKEYFWDKIVGDLYESTLDIMAKARLLEEANDSFEHSYKIEETARLILENGIFARFPNKKKKELTDDLIEASFYPYSFTSKRARTMDSVLEEGVTDWLQNTSSSIGRGVTNTARFFKSIYLVSAMFLVSPATAILSNAGKQGLDAVGDKVAPGLLSKGTSPSTRKYYELMNNLSPIRWIYSFLTKDQHDIFKYLKQANNLENDYIQDVLKLAGGDSSKIVDKCWNKNKIQMVSKDPNKPSFTEMVQHFFSGKGIANAARDPKYNDETQLMVTLSSDASDPIYQKRFFDFRVCVFDKMFEIILGYAKAVYSMDDSSYEVIKSANDAHNSKNFKAFFDLRPKQDNDAAMFAIMKALVAIDDIARTLEGSKGVLAADKYVDKFSQYLTQNVKQVYSELDEMANQKKYNEDRYADDDPDEDEKIAKIKEERFNQKKSIFSN